MRLWVKPDQLAKLGITVSEIANAVKAQNTVNPAGQVGGEPAADGQKFTYAVRAQGRLKTPEEFGDIVVRENADGGVVRVRDVAHVELGSQDYSWITRLNGKRHHRYLPVARFKCGGSGQRGTEADGQNEGEIPCRYRLCRHFGYD